jgi:DNA ligase-1
MRPMLASKWEARNEEMFPFWAQPKLDGIRVIIKEDGYAYTRSMKPIRSEFIQSQIRLRANQLIGLDAEIIVGDETAPDCYRRTSSAVMSFDNPDAENFSLHVFDIWNHDGDYDDRYGALLGRASDLPGFVRVVPSALLSDMAMLQEYQERRLAEGHEGVILRRRDAMYKFGRGTPKGGELIKLKEFEDAEGIVLAVHELMHNGNEAKINELGYTEHSGHKAGLVPMDTLGALEISLTEPFSPSEVVRVGSGFTQEQRKQLWEQRDRLIGKIVKYKYFKVGVKDKPRFPIFLGFRDPDDMDQGSLF